MSREGVHADRQRERRVPAGPGRPRRSLAAVCVEAGNEPNNVALYQLIIEAGITVDEALDRFNEGQARPISRSCMTSWLATPGANRWRPVSDAMLEHARKVFTAPKATV